MVRRGLSEASRWVCTWSAFFVEQSRRSRNEAEGDAQWPWRVRRGSNGGARAWCCCDGSELGEGTEAARIWGLRAGVRDGSEGQAE